MQKETTRKQCDNTMTIAERHKHILQTLERDGFVKVIDMANELDVTAVTIRKDLKVLEGKGLLYRTHGSASPSNPHMGDKNVSDKEKINPVQKDRIGARAAAMIDPNDSIIINSGSTICSFAKHIVPKGQLTVASASLMATLIMSERDGINILQLGGNYRRHSMSVFSNYTLGFLEDIACSKLFLGVDGVAADFGVTTSNLEEAALNKAMMNTALKTVVLCDSSKFGKKGFGKICNLDKIDTIVTDDGITDSMRQILEDAGIEVVIA